VPLAALPNVEMYYEVHGSGEPIVCVCGISIDHNYFQPQISGLSNEFQVIVFDNRDAGQTRCDVTEYDINDMADDIADLLAELSVDKIHLLGFSMGGFIAQSFAARYPHKLKSLILVGTAAKVSNRARRVTINWLNLASKLSREDCLKEAFLWLYSTSFFENDHNWRKLLKLLLDSPPTQTQEQFARQARAMRQPDFREMARKIRVPTLILVGTEERVFTVGDSKEMSELIPGAEFQILEGLAHNLTAESPIVVNERIASFCRRHGDPAQSSPS
jgi:3-oxoadipate enol-lactonase